MGKRGNFIKILDHSEVHKKKLDLYLKMLYIWTLKTKNGNHDKFPFLLKINDYESVIFLRIFNVYTIYLIRRK